MKRTLERLLFLALILLLGVAGCDEATLHKTMSDLTTDTTGSLEDPFENGTLQNPNWR